MKAIFLTKTGDADRAFETREIAIPTISENEVLIKVHSFGLNFADVVARRGMYPDAPKMPSVLGYDVAGIVEDIGDNIRHVSRGDRVCAMTRFGGYAQYAKTMGAGVAKIPDRLSFAEATALSTQACTAYYCLHESVSVHPKDRVLIHAAAGGVGSFLSQMAKLKGCEVIGTASHAKHEFAKSNGVDLCIDYNKESFSERIESELGKHSIDYIFDSIGGKTFKNGMGLLRLGGRMVSYGAASQMHGNKTGILRSIPVLLGFGLYSPLKLLMKSQAIIGVNMLRIADHKPQVLQHVLSQVIKMCEEGNLKVHVSKAFGESQIAEAHSYLENRQSVGKVVVNW